MYLEDMLIWKEGRLCFAHACEIMTAITERRRFFPPPQKKAKLFKEKSEGRRCFVLPRFRLFFWAEKILRNKHLGINIKLKNIPSALLWKRPPPLFFGGGGGGVSLSRLIYRPKLLPPPSISRKFAPKKREIIRNGTATRDLSASSRMRATR